MTQFQNYQVEHMEGLFQNKNIWKENAMLQIFYRIQRGKIKANIWNEERILEEKSPKRRKLHGFNFNVPYRWILFHEAS
jgi:hypothetical protein